MNFDIILEAYESFCYNTQKTYENYLYGKDGLLYGKRQLLLSRVIKTLGTLGIVIDASYVWETFNVIMANSDSHQLSYENIISIIVMVIAITICTKGQKISQNILLDLDNANVKKRQKSRNFNEWGSFRVE